MREESNLVFEAEHARKVTLAEYDPQQIEAKWQKIWEEQGAFHAVDGDASRQKYYLLEMLPYPSGTLHMGHMRNYTIGDAVARYKRMRGFNVLHPIGWDAFGLPAENAAIKRGTPPREWTNANIAQMKAVCSASDSATTGDREISTCEPEYYRWNQWFFLRMLEKGLAFRKTQPVNWCPQVPDRPRQRAGDRRLLLAARHDAGGSRKISSNGSCASRSIPTRCWTI